MLYYAPGRFSFPFSAGLKAMSTRCHCVLETLQSIENKELA